MDESQPAEVQVRDTALDTYRFLRGGMVVMIVMLAVAVIGERLTATCWQTSISAYYFTSAHGIFIAALCAIGVFLIVYKGSNDTEDVLLNLAGILAFIVAMVPTSRPVLCGWGLPADYQVDNAVANNVWAVIIALAVARVLAWSMYRKTRTSEPKSPLGVVSQWVLRAVVAIGLIGFLFFRKQFDSNAHGLAAVAMFIAIIVVVVLTAFLVSRQDLSPHKRLYHFVYRVIAAAMIATLVTVVVLHFVLDDWNHWVIVVEAALIGEFAAYWAVQTVELWQHPDRNELIPPEKQPQLAVASEPGVAPQQDKLMKAL
jgi:hypothetical protein